MSVGDFRVRATWTGVGVIGGSGVGTAAVALDRRRTGNQLAKDCTR
jgi:purine nucleoside phosphorylase